MIGFNEHESGKTINPLPSCHAKLHGAMQFPELFQSLDRVLRKNQFVAHRGSRSSSTAPVVPAPVPILLKEDVDMRTSDFAPLYRATVGFDRLIERLDNSLRPEWPPYDIERIGDDAYRISMAVAGFALEEIDVTQTGNVLFVAGRKKTETPPRQGMLHQGLAFRSFRQSFNLADHVKVTGANLVNGMLSIDLVRELPEALQPRRIEIGTEAVSAPAPQLADQSEATARAA